MYSDYCYLKRAKSLFTDARWCVHVFNDAEVSFGQRDLPRPITRSRPYRGVVEKTPDVHQMFRSDSSREVGKAR